MPRPSLWDYLREAFNARPIGMFLPPNWAMLAGFGLAGWLHDPGWLVLGAGAEMGYLLLLSTNARFQRFVAGKMGAAESKGTTERWYKLVGALPDVDKRRYANLAQRCQAVIEQQFHGDASAPGYAAQSDSLGRLTWMYLRLLVTRQGILKVMRESGGVPGGPPPVPGSPAASLDKRLADLQRRLADPSISEDLRRSLQGQADLLEQRVERRGEAADKLAFLEAELTRIEEQVELIREQAALSTDPEHFSQRIDEIGATLGTTGEWISAQQQTIGAMDDLIAEPPPLAAQTRARELQ
jgi:hypothetical protein